MQKRRKPKYTCLYIFILCFTLPIIFIITINLFNRYLAIKTVKDFATIRFNIDYKNLDDCQQKRNSYYAEEFLKAIDDSGDVENINNELIQNQEMSHLISQKVLYHGQENDLIQVILYATIEYYSEANILSKNYIDIAWLISLRRCDLWHYKIVTIEEFMEDSHHHD